MWEERCRRAGGWKATQNHAVCSLHFLDWNNGPSPEHSDPTLFAYNGWGRNHHAVINRKANSLQCQGQDVIAAPNASTSTQCNTETQFPQEEVLPLNVQDWGEVEVCTATEDSDTTLPDESCNVLGDHTYGAYTHNETVAEPVDVEVQTDQFTTLEKASQTYEEVHEWERNNVVEDGALRNAFIQKILRSRLITFVSSVYGGNTSDRYTAEAEFIDKVEPGDAIMWNIVEWAQHKETRAQA
ncbi:hypothetical protein O3P69_010935 [Scylla paramamosain]|uniref:THAP-type domain-containing protein n=1 Tax=Scylla paramamosain TaxID=85552 RepID=A0AAW0SE77_SCYPA